MKPAKIGIIAAVIAAVVVAAVVFVNTRPAQIVHITASGPTIDFQQTSRDGTLTEGEVTGVLELDLPAEQVRSYQVTVSAGVDGTTSTCLIHVSGGIEPDHTIENSTQGLNATATCTYQD